jgi:hypothetical protein
MNKLTIVLSGKKQSGKSTMCNYIRARYLNTKFGYKSDTAHYGIDDLGLLTFLTHDGRKLKESSNFLFGDPKSHDAPDYSVKVYSFADPLKDFCINVLGLSYENCWGTDAQKNSIVPHLLWDNLPEALRPKVDNNKLNSGAGEDHVNAPTLKSGPMTGREVMQIVGTDICRRFYGDCWARGTYNKIKHEGVELALVADARFPNEITIGKEVKAKTVRLGRNISNDNHASEIALDNFSKDKYTLYVDNSNFSIEEQCAFFDPYIDQWFAEAGIA